MLRRLIGIVALGALAFGVTAAQAGVDAGDLCKEKKGKAAGKYAQDIAKAFGKNVKTPDPSKLAGDVAKAHSKLTKGFISAEDGGGCNTTGDVGAIEDKVDTVNEDVVGEIAAGAPPCSPIVGPCGKLSFTTVPPVGNCGRINDDPAGTGTDLTPYAGGIPDLKCGSLYIGGGGSVQPPSPTPDGAATIYKISSCATTAMTLVAATSTDTGSNNTCSAPACNFGPPLPIPNPASPGVSTCVLNRVAAAPPSGGSLNGATGDTTIALPLTVSTYVTGDLNGAGLPIQPCPKCVAGLCDFGPNAGGTCTTPTSLGTSHDCPPPTTALPAFGVDLTPLVTGTATDVAGGAGFFCAPQAAAGAFGKPTARYIEENGTTAGSCITGGGSYATTLASVFCIPPSGAPLVDAVASLPGPGAIALTGTSALIP
jgi:hypothetical protein